MAETIFKDATILINTVELKPIQVGVELGYAEVDVLKMGNAAGNKKAGIAEQQITASFIQDFASSSVHQTLNTALANCATGGTCNVVVKPVNTANSATNPWFSLSDGVLLSYNPIPSVQVGDKGVVTVTFKTSGNAISIVTT
jgi:hypothetical protein